MAYTVLARRYRSRTFDEVVGQEHVAQTLKKAISTGRVAHAYLFTGTRGVGKTSMARILAVALNDPSAESATPTPNPDTDTARAIFRGEDVDVIEIDAASNTGVDNVRDLIENSRFRPMHSRFKVYIIDEVHMLSKAAFNALLKTMEEPPEHVKFILATTEVDKVPPTILSRCQRYDFRNIPTAEIAGHLRSVIKQEGLEAEDDAVQLVSRAGAGSMRDALSLLDRLLSFGESPLRAETVEQLLGLPRGQLIAELAGAMAGGDVAGVLGKTQAMLDNGIGADVVVSSLSAHLRDLLVVATCGQDTPLVESAGVDRATLAEQAGQFDTAALVQDIAVLEELRRSLRQSGLARALLDATLARLAMAEQFAPLSELVGAAPRAARGAEKKTADRNVERVSSPPRAGSPRADSADGETERTSSVDPSAAASAELTRVWTKLIGRFADQPGTVGVLQSATLEQVTADVATLRIPADQPTAAARLHDRREQIATHLGELLGRAVKVTVHRDNTVTSKAATSAAEARNSVSTADAKMLEERPVVAALMKELGGVIVKIEPAD